PGGHSGLGGTGAGGGRHAGPPCRPAPGPGGGGAVKRLLCALLVLCAAAACTTSRPVARPSATPSAAPLVYVAVGASESVGVGASDPLRNAWPQVFYRTALPPSAGR